jgi:manganese/zinc/iron transport system substrate-binding protein
MRIAGFLVRSLLVALLLAPAGCGGTQEESSHGKPHGGPVSVSKTHSGGYPIKAVCTTGMVADLVRNIGGERVEV